jgi:hypothetical protein
MGVGIAAARPMPVRRGVIAVFPMNPGHRSSCLQTLFTGWGLRARQARFHFDYDGFGNTAFRTPSGVDRRPLVIQSPPREADFHNGG